MREKEEEKEKGLGGWKRREEKGSSRFVILEKLPSVRSAMVVVIEKPNVMTFKHSNF